MILNRETSYLKHQKLALWTKAQSLVLFDQGLIQKPRGQTRGEGGS